VFWLARVSLPPWTYQVAIEVSTFHFGCFEVLTFCFGFLPSAMLMFGVGFATCLV
jgi:hypothetical protein